MQPSKLIQVTDWRDCSFTCTVQMKYIYICYSTREKTQQSGVREPHYSITDGRKKRGWAGYS